MLAVRTVQPAFHPDAEQTVVETGQESIVAFVRTSQDEKQRILVLANVGELPVCVDLSTASDVAVRQNLLTGEAVEGDQYRLGSYDIAWLSSD